MDGAPGIRAVWRNGWVWWHFEDLADFLRIDGTEERSNALARLEPHDRSVARFDGESVAVVAQYGLEGLMPFSDHPEAQKFIDWLCDEVLPIIRKTRSYTNPHGTVIPGLSTLAEQIARHTSIHARDDW